MSEVRHLTREELSRLMDWAAVEGWNPGLHDADAFWAADPRGFYGMTDAEGVSAGVSCVTYGRTFGFVGLYIVRPDRREQGVGSRLWRHAVQSFDVESAGLDGVPAQQENYRRSGYVLAHRNIRFGGVRKAPLAHPSKVVFPLDVTLIPSVTNYEQSGLFPAGRSAFLKLWLSLPGHRAWGLGSPADLTGYIVTRPCGEGTKVGPLFANSFEIASELLRHALWNTPRTPIYIDVPEPNQAGVRLARDFGLRPVFETARMYRGKNPGLDLPRIFGITTFEIG